MSTFQKQVLDELDLLSLNWPLPSSASASATTNSSSTASNATNATGPAAPFMALHADLQEQIELLDDFVTNLNAGPKLDDSSKDGVELGYDLESVEGMMESAENVKKSADEYQKRLTALDAQLSKFVKKAEESERDPDTAIYGVKMIKSIKESHQRFHALSELATPLVERFRSLAASAAEFRTKLAARQVRIQQAEKAAEDQRQQLLARQQEIERQREIAAQKAEAERQQAEEKHKQEERAREAEAAKARAAEEERRRAEQASQAAAESQRLREEEAKRKQEADARAQAEVKAREAAAPPKPFKDRCLEGIAESIRQIQTSCNAQEALIALQTISKLIENIIANPRDEYRFRWLRADNEILKRRILSRPGGILMFESFGFSLIQSPASVPAGSNLAPSSPYYKMEARADLWPVLVEGRARVDAAISASRTAPSQSPAQTVPVILSQSSLISSLAHPAPAPSSTTPSTPQIVSNIVPNSSLISALTHSTPSAAPAQSPASTTEQQPTTPQIVSTIVPNSSLISSLTHPPANNPSSNSNPAPAPSSGNDDDMEEAMLQEAIRMSLLESEQASKNSESK